MTQDLIKRIQEHIEEFEAQNSRNVCYCPSPAPLLQDLKSYLQEAEKQNELACQIRYNTGRADGICEAIKTRERMG